MKFKKPMIVIALLFGLVILVLFAGKMNLSFRFHREVKDLFKQSGTVSNKTFNYLQLSGLPQPVQRYFKLVLKQGQPYVSYARIKHDGQFKPGFDKNWTRINGEQYATTQKPGFIWKGTTAMFTARDMYISDKGRLVVSLFSLYNIVNVRGEHYDQGELLRWLGESVLYPTNLLPGDKLQWSAIDTLKAKFTFKYNGMSLFYIVTFNDTGEIIQMETERYMDPENLETWIIKIAGYKEWNKIMVPTDFEVLWRLKKGDFSYAKFNIKQVEYDKPYKF